MSAHNFTKVHLLKVYLAVHKCDIVCLSETCLNSNFSFDDDNLHLPVCIRVRADHPAYSKRGGVFMYYKSCLPLSPNQLYDDFVSFLEYFELTLDT